MRESKKHPSLGLNLFSAFLGLSLGLFLLRGYCTEIDSSGIAPPALTQATTCSYYFADTYNNAQSSTPPTFAQQSVNIGNAQQASPLQLAFGTTSAYSATPAVPCAGTYEIFFSVELVSNSGLNCRDGQQTIGIWATSSDAGTPNVYGCPLQYCNTGNGTCSGTYSGSYQSPYVCKTFSQWVQCAWGNNGWTSFLYNTAYPPIRAYPLFMYTPYWIPDVSLSVYTGSWFGSQYMIPYNGLNFCQLGSRHGFYCGIMYGYASAIPLQTAYCSRKTFYFKNVVTLGKGAVVYAPALVGLPSFEPYPAGTPSTTSSNTACGFSVVGGKFTVTLLHSP